MHGQAQDCMTLDGIPYIGEYATKYTPNLYVATGFNKWGMIFFYDISNYSI